MKSMDRFYTSVEMPAGLPRFSHRDRLLLMGSCFATNIGTRLLEAKFACDVNPYGVLYNPLSISAALREALAGKVYAEADLYEHGGLWHSPMHHGDFSAPTAAEALERINARLEAMRAELSRLDVLLLTWGTAWVYEEARTSRIVGNCHKLPERCFCRRRLPVEEMVDDYTELLADLWKVNPGLKVVFTVSPIRHVRDGLHANQLSKAALLLAIASLEEKFPAAVCYFPAYEIVLDELRDYRFYADDMLHPSASAVNYIWECFCETYFTPKTRALISECRDIRQALEHRPFHPESPAYKSFLTQIVLRINRLTEKYPTLDFRKELKLCHTRLKQ